ncbi:probable G-protein coupled receptor 139 [Pristis pectinata]|uniref:probable G-protein coupled receptor 139 n=1 Tax=Pristis pectinata TaxID=685728 RepID=UPI00223D31C7|nr:probable G-protein coupled receptor 139 [Pristis pectinata]
MAIAILSRGNCGLSKCITLYLVAMATSDLSVIVFEVILNRVSGLYWSQSFLFYTPVCRLIQFLAPVAIDCSVWFTVAFTFDRFVALSTQNLKNEYCTERTAVVLLVTLCALFCLKNLPWPFAYVAIDVYNEGISRDCRISSHFYTMPAWVAFSWTEQLLTPVVPFCLILLFNILTVRRILFASRIRRSLRDLSSVVKEKDPEMGKRRQSIILLLAISSSFIMLWATTVAYFIYFQTTKAFRRRTWIRPLATFERIGVMLHLLSSCTNTAIYSVTQRKFRMQLLQALKYLLTGLYKSVK